MNPRGLDPVAMLSPHHGSRTVVLALLTVLALPALLARPAGLTGQAGTVAVERENFRAIPRGTIVAEVLGGTELALGERQDQWRAATLEGWVWSNSVRTDRRGGYDLSVSVARGENLRATPNGTILARLHDGMLLEELEADGNWIRVRRTAWIWEPSLDVSEPGGAAEPAPPAARAAEAPPSPAPAPARAQRDFGTAGEAGLLVVDQPGGDTLGRIHAGRTVEVLAREGDWVRVRVEGWAFEAGLARGDTAGTAVLRNVDRRDLRENPHRYRGRLVEWDLQFISLQKAERFRTDFLEGETFILARGPGDDGGFVYVAVSAERADEVRGLIPLQRIRVLGRIRTARSPLTEAPVIDLLEVTARGGTSR